MRQIFWFCHLRAPFLILVCHAFNICHITKAPTRHLSSFISFDVSFLSFLDFPSASIFHRPRFFRSVICRFFHRSIHPSYICPLLPQPQPKRPPGVQKNKLSSWHIFDTTPLQNYGVSTHFPVSAWIALSEKNTLWTCALPACFVTFDRIFSGITHVLHLLTLEDR